MQWEEKIWRDHMRKSRGTLSLCWLLPCDHYWGHGGASVPMHSHPCSLCLQRSYSSCPSSGYLVSWCDGKNWCLFSSIWNPQYGSSPCSDPEHLRVGISLPRPSTEYTQTQKFRPLTNRGMWDMGEKTLLPLLGVTEERQLEILSQSWDTWKHGRVCHLCYVSHRTTLSEAISPPHNSHCYFF